MGSFVWTGNPNLPGSRHPEWPQWSNAAGEPKVIVFDADLTTYDISTFSIIEKFCLRRVAE